MIPSLHFGWAIASYLQSSLKNATGAFKTLFHIYNQFHNILRLNVLPNFPFTTSETMPDELLNDDSLESSPPRQKKNFANSSKKVSKNSHGTLPAVRHPTRKPELVPNIPQPPAASPQQPNTLIKSSTADAWQAPKYTGMLRTHSEVHNDASCENN